MIHLSGRLSSEHRLRPEHVVIRTLAAIKNVGAPGVPLTHELFRLLEQRALHATGKEWKYTVRYDDMGMFTSINWDGFVSAGLLPLFSPGDI